MSALNTCFNSISTIHSVYYNQRHEYKTAWETFRKIELYNSNVSTQHGEGNKDTRYYQYLTNSEKSHYRQGASLFQYYLGYSNIVEKN